MNGHDPIAEARTAAESILAALDVARVVYVDDANGGNVSLEDVIAAAVGLDATQLAGAMPELGEAIPDEPDVLRQKLRDVWRQLDATTQAERGQAVLVAARRHDDNEVDDVADASILSDLIPKAKLVSISPAQWEAQKEQLLKDSKDQRTLFLFDRDFSETGGDAEGGIKIIASLLAKNDTESLICGLLTHTVTPEDQPAKWVELSETYSIPRDRFLVVPKQHLSKDPVLFAQILKLIALSPDFASMKEKTRKIIGDATATAGEHVEDISIYDLDYIVFRVSAEEGMWEPDMLFRLHALFHRLEARRLAHEGGDLETIAKRLRSVSDIPTDTVFHPVSSTWKLQRKELYESPDYLNKTHLPLELGDIFDRTGTDSKKHYILLAQPCDLMVRRDGKRHPDLARVPLVEVFPAAGDLRYSEEIPYFGDQPGERWFVRLDRVHYISTAVLDLCVFDDNGKAIIRIDSDPPDTVRPSWQTRFRILRTMYQRKLARISLLSGRDGDLPDVAKARSEIRKGLLGDLLDEGLFKGQIPDDDGYQTTSFNCQRVGRISRARAFGLLMAYTSCLCRPAYDSDFAKPPVSEEGSRS